MKKLLLISSFILGFILINSHAYAQFGYKENYKTIDGVEISYKWSHAKFLNKNSPIQLRFKMKNTNDYPVKIEFELVYMIDHIVKFESGELSADIKAGKAISGKLNGFYFETDVLSNQELQAENFSWDFLFFNVISNHDK
jgi:hypothetical protein